MLRSRRTAGLAGFVCAALCALVPQAAAAGRPSGPALGIAKSKLAAALTCSQGFAKSKRAPVLLTPAFSSDELSYGWNYFRQLEADRIPFCSISVPDEGHATFSGRPSRGVAITSISSKDGALITPQPAASRRRGVHHVLLQRVCPGRVVDHFAALADNVAYRLFRDARSHRGPASAWRLPVNACARQHMPAADPANLSLTGLFLESFFARNAASNDREPPVAPYARRR